MDNLLKRIKSLDRLSDVEMKIANYYEQNYPTSLTETIGQISVASDTSVASVSRFIQRLGYSNFSDLKQEVGVLIAPRLISPIEKYEESKTKKVAPKYSAETHFNQCIENIRETNLRLDTADFNLALKKICSAKKLYVVGGASANTLANYFVIFAKYLRENVYLLTPDVSTLAHTLVDVQKTDLLLAITHYRVSSVTTKIAKYFNQVGAEVILIADRSTTPITPFASVSLTVRSGGTPMFSSRVATLAMLESIINCMIPFNEKEAKDRFKVMEAIFDDYDVYSK